MGERPAHAELAARLRERRSEIQAAVATRVYAISDPHLVGDPGYLDGLNAAVATAVDHRLEALEAGGRRVPPIPPLLLAQARIDARDGVPLDTVLRRYIAGNSLFGDFLAEESGRAAVPSSDLRSLLAAQAALGDRLVAAVSAEHAREAQAYPTNATERRRDCVKGLIAGELVDLAQLDYEIDAHHLAGMASGEEAPEVMRLLAARVDRRLLAVRREEEPTWAFWLGGLRSLDSRQAISALAEVARDGVLVTVGEPGEGLVGWRLSHRQARAALPIAQGRRQSALRYADVALLAAIRRDDLITSSLRRLYLEPLDCGRDGGAVARRTLRAYFAAERNVSSTAAALGVDRRTVSNRIRAVEEIFDRPLHDLATELDIALQMEEWEAIPN